MSAQETKPINLKPFLPSSSEGLKKFITQFPRLPYGVDEFESFCQNLASSNDCVLDLWQASQRVAVAVLLDKLETRPHSLEIAILGYRWDFSASQFLDFVLPLGKKRALEQKKTRLELVSSLGLKVGPPDLQHRGFQPSSTTITFETNQINPQLLVSVPSEWHWKEAGPSELSLCYDLLKSNVPSLQADGLVPFSQFEKLANLLPIKPRLLLENNQRPVAFVWVALQGATGQLLFMARHPDFKGKGVGKSCLSEAARLLKPFGFKKLVAEVKESDQAAVKLFETSGFRTSRKLTLFSLST